jgi:ubiquitin carboxyl-terminal hydrolase L5
MNTYDEDFYFAKQVIVNACATQAILGILMNNDDLLDIGSDLSELKSFTKLMDPYMKGLCISNCEKVRIEHNKFAKPEPFVFSQKKKKVTEEDEVFHYVSYIHFKNNIYEIDGLQEGPILLAENVNKNDWIDKLKPMILERINLYANNEIKFNLLALVPDRRARLIGEEKELVDRIEYVNRILIGENMDVDIDMENNFNEYDAISKDELVNILNELNINLDQIRMYLYEENQKFDKYKVKLII